MIAQVLFISTIVAIAQAGLLHGGLDLGGSSYIGSPSIAVAKEPVVEYWAPPKYEYKYGVQDYHTGDVKNQEESRVGDLTQSDYSLAEKDRKIQVSRIIAGAVPISHGKSW
ncbi:adult-specific cuticular protein ACP-20-like [Diabrotica undecimpunctata]|uniref:adult-specific cuticular protein ACP-20-like n=1 Tax=Diabrotica undecimpunctata TaxID=50387 RepID=UPI003B634764